MLFFFKPFTFNFGALIPQILLLATSNWISFSLIQQSLLIVTLYSLTFIMIVGIFWLVSTILAWFLFVSFFLFLFSSFLLFLFFVVCVYLFFCLFISLGDFILLVFSLALYLNCLLLYFIQYFCIIKKKGTISFISTICPIFIWKAMYVCILSLSYTGQEFL